MHPYMKTNQKKCTRHLVQILLALSALLLLLTVGTAKTFAATTVASGTYSNLTWSLDSEGTLTITGDGSSAITLSGGWSSYKSSVKKLVVGEGVTAVSYHAFYEYTSLTSVSIAGNVKTIGSYAFYGCSSLTSLTLSEGVENIESDAFFNCTALTSVTIPGTVTSIGTWAFYQCSDLTRVVLQEGVTEINASAFCKCSSLTSITIPSTVTSIGESAFSGCSKLSSLTLPANLTEIGDFAFYSCTSLTSIRIPASVTSIGSSAFGGCTSLKTATIAGNGASIGSSAFANCTALTKVTLSDGVKTIETSAFRSCTALTSISVPSTVTEIGSYAFSGCNKLTGISLPGSVTSIGDYAFYQCTRLASVTLASGLKSIGSCAFQNCKALTDITIPSTVTSLGSYAFYSCTALKKAVIRTGAAAIPESCFAYCSKLATVSLAAGISSIGEEAFYSCEALEAISIPGSVSQISGSAFSDCSSLICLYISDGVKKIGARAFSYCSSLEIVRIPKSVTSIGNYAFSSCGSLEEVYYGGSKTKWASLSDTSDLKSASIKYNSTTSVVIPRTTVTVVQIVSGGLRIRWEKAYGAKGYIIYRKTSGGSYKKIGKVTSGSTLSYTDKTVTKNKTYYYKVKGYAGSVKSAASSARSAKYISGTVKTVSSPSAVSSYNINGQNYSTWSSSVTSYLVKVSSGFMRVEYVDGKVVVEYYDSKWRLTKQKKITCELELFGGFYAGEDAYYLVFGQNNPKESDATEVIRVVKYSTNWKRKSNASVYGANTYIPFDAGSLSMTEYNGYLYIRTCHEMYQTSDGLHHQANLTIGVKESSMTVFYCASRVSSTSTGYVSHSFNQKILVDDKGNLIAADHGDAYPRAMVLFRYDTKAGSSTLTGSNSNVDVLTIQGTTGNNATKASLGGLEYSSSSYLLAGNSVKQNSSWSSHSQRNIFVTVTSRSDFSASGTKTKWITSYSEKKNISVSTPQLVKISNKKFLLMWTENSTTLKYVFLDGKGNKLTDIYSAKAGLSDCQPIYADGYVYWYTTNSSKPTLCAIKVSSPSAVLTSDGYLSAPTLRSAKSTSSGVKLTWTGTYNATGYIIYRKTGSGSYKKLKKITRATTVTYTDKTAKSGKKYTYRILAYNSSGSKTKKSKYSKAKSITYKK